MRYDAVVVGAGPAGASAAHVLARGGARVLLLEKARIPRYKPCGGAITIRSRAASPLVATYEVETHTTAALISDGNHRIVCDLPAPIGMVMRDRFDAYLADCAGDAGAEVRDGVALASLAMAPDGVRIRSGTDTIHASYVIGADGANGLTARHAGFEPMRDPAAAIEVELATPDAVRARYSEVAAIDFLALRGGYGWIFGKGDHLSCGVGVFQAGGRRDLRQALDRFLSAYPDLRGSRVLLRRGHRVPMAGGRATRRRGPVLLAGDAASLADPLTGEGICYALASGRRAGASVLGALHGAPEALHAYDRYLDEELCADLRYARIVAALTYRFPDLVVRLAREHPRMRATNAAAVSGTASYRSLVLRLVAHLPTLVRAVVARGFEAMPAA